MCARSAQHSTNRSNCWNHGGSKNSDQAVSSISLTPCSSPDDLGLPRPVDVDRVARLIWEGSAVEGVSGYETRALFYTKKPIGMFCIARDSRKRGARFGFAGLLPSYRRTRIMASAAKTVGLELARLDAFPITMEIDTRNRRSLRMAERRCGPPKGWSRSSTFEIEARSEISFAKSMVSGPRLRKSRHRC